MTDSAEETVATCQQTLTGDVRTRLVNQKNAKTWDVDIGRADGGTSNIENTAPGEPGWLGNPYALSDGYDREESIEKYRTVFKRRLRESEEFREAVENLRGKTLACWCKPKPCHGDVILAYLRGEFDAE